MIRREHIVATSRVDRHREQIALSGLESLVETANTSYVPVIIEHDPRCPPIGRVVSARIDKLPDGHHAVISTYEIFEPGDEIHSVPGREVPIRGYDEGRVQLCFDRTYRDPDSQALIEEISELLGSEPQEEGKKALEPLSVLIIGAAVGLGAIATGFLNAVGADAYAAVKSKLKKLSVPRRGEHAEQLLRFEFATSDGSTVVNVDVIFTNPTDDDVDYALGRMLHDLDRVLPSVFARSRDVRRFVFVAENDHIHLKFAVRWDAAPLFPQDVSDTADAVNDSSDKIRRSSAPRKDGGVD